jgi:hypothetical protein
MDLTVREVFRVAADALEAQATRPHGPHAEANTVRVGKHACVALAGGDRDKAVALWRLLEHELGYMPQAVVHALIRASGAPEITVPDEAPEVS